MSRFRVFMDKLVLVMVLIPLICMLIVGHFKHPLKSERVKPGSRLESREEGPPEIQLPILGTIDLGHPSSQTS